MAERDVKPERVRTLTPKAMALHDEQRKKFHSDLRNLTEQLYAVVRDPEGEEQQLTDSFANYVRVEEEFATYLQTTRTTDSLAELERLSETHAKILKDVTLVRDRLTYQRQSSAVFSPLRGNSVRSSVSKTSSKALSAKAKAAEARMVYVEREALLKKQKAEMEEQRAIAAAAAAARKQSEIESEIELTKEKMNAAEIKAEAEALEELEGSKTSSCGSVHDLPGKTDHVVDYVRSVPNMPCKTDHVIDYVSSVPDMPCRTDHVIDYVCNVPNMPCKTDHVIDFVSNVPNMPDKKEHNDISHVPNTNNYDQLTKFLLRKELAINRLSVYNGKAEDYISWKTSFCSVCSDLAVTPPEEIDLLVKWLGKETRTYAINIRSAWIHDPPSALVKIWKRLDERFGAAENVHQSITTRLENFPKITNRDSIKLYELTDILNEVEGLKSNTMYSTALSYFDSSIGIKPIVAKLPYFLQEKWVNTASSYKGAHHGAFPPFSEFISFVERQARIRNDPSLVTSDISTRSEHTRKQVKNTTSVNAAKTEVNQNRIESAKCPIHKSDHDLAMCRTFKTMTFLDKRKLLKDNKLCFKCFGGEHVSKDCKKHVVCSVCQKGHNTSMHIQNLEAHGGEHEVSVNNKCTQVCGSSQFSGKSCAKIVLVHASDKNQPSRKVKTYAIIDDQSNCSLVKPSLIDSLGLVNEDTQYSINTCNGVQVVNGRQASGLVLESLNYETKIELPSVLECADIPNQRHEIPTPEVTEYFQHLQDVHIPPLDQQAEITMLIGRDLIRAHHVLEQRTGKPHSPYAQRLPLGWVIIGETCLGSKHEQRHVNVHKTFITSSGRPTAFSQCENSFKLTGHYKPLVDESSLFVRYMDDDKPGLSVEDRDFLELMDGTFSMDKYSGKWSAPLPFKKDRDKLPNNLLVAKRRAQLLDTSLKKNNVKCKHFVEFMQKLFENDHVERAPALQPDQECWYLPIFGVYHPKKPGQIRAVFDSSAKFQNVSLNDILMSGLDLTNSLLGVLLRFRKDEIAVTADIQQMFYCFEVPEEHRDYLRFLWYEDNDPGKQLIQYRMKVHVFGNKPSPAVANYGLKRIAELSGNTFGTDVETFISRDFYVDDGLTSLPSEDKAVDLLKRTQQAMQIYGDLRLHKIASNSVRVLQEFSRDDLAKNLTDIDLSCTSDVPMQRSLGLGWNIQSDAFTFQISSEEKPYTRRGVLSTINSIYDPIGFAAPVVLVGKLILRDLVAKDIDWDDPLPIEHYTTWKHWCDSLENLQQVEIPRTYSPSFSLCTKKKLHVYCDASERAVSAAAYIISESQDGLCSTSFVMGKTKVAPSSGHTIPRLELCAAVLAAELGDTVQEQIGIHTVKYFSDSKVVLGYICNRTRRFFNYVSNRVEKINCLTDRNQWHYVPTHLNPADCGTRGVAASDLADSHWLKGPTVDCYDGKEEDEGSSYPLVEANIDKEVRVTVCSTKVVESESRSIETVLETRFERYSEWPRLKCAIACMQHIAESYHGGECKGKGWHWCDTIDQQPKAEALIIQSVQKSAYPEEYRCLQEKKPVSRSSSIVDLHPFIDKDGVMRVGGRLCHSQMANNEKHPAIIPKKSHVAVLLVRHYHNAVKHQGRHFTEGALRSNGYWIVSAKRLVSSVVHDCVQCRRLRGPFSSQIMADLPPDRVQPAPPFTYVGVDTFGPWHIVTRRTRGGQANSKRWAIMFTCLTIRAVEIEVVEDMSSSAFINALRRFIARHGNVKQFRSDRGTNFIGATNELRIDSISDECVKRFLHTSGTQWVFNAPHSSHMGGSWERMIGVARRILDSMLLDVKTLTHDILVTLMTEVCAIINARPIVPISTDSDDPEVLSPSALLTRKADFTSRDEYMDVNADIKQIYKAEWKCVQALADKFWKRWRNEYLQQLQPRRKWQCEYSNMCIGDVVLMKDHEVCRNEWPFGIVQEVFPCKDGKVRKVSIRLRRDGKSVVLTRPIHEMVLLVSQNQQ